MIFFNLKCHINNPTLGPYEKGCLEGLELAIFENAGFIGKNHVPSLLLCQFHEKNWVK